MAAKFEFNYKPMDIVSHLDRYVLGQQSAKQVLASAICSHYHRIANISERDDPFMDTLKSHALIMGPTGTGKTRLVRLATQFLNLPCYEANAPDYTAAGYVGDDVDEIPRRLLQKANGKLELAQMGIVYIDEVDKIAEDKSRMGRDIRGGAVQDLLLKLVEGYEVYDKKEKTSISTKNMLFIFSGAFDNIDEIIQNRIAKNKKKAGLGFSGNAPIISVEEQLDLENHPLQKNAVTTEDLIEYGIKHQLLARIGLVANLDKLSQSNLYEILTMPSSDFVPSRQRDFKYVGIDLRFEDEALKLVAKKAYERNTGCRSLNQILGDVCAPFYTALPSTVVKDLTITKDIVENPQLHLETMLKSNPILIYTDLSKDPSKVSKTTTGTKTSAIDPIGVKFDRKQFFQNLPKEIPVIYRSDAYEYYKRNDVSVTQLPVVVDEINKGIREYLKEFYVKYEKKLLIDKPVHDKLVGLMLSAGTTDAPKVLFGRIGMHLEDPNKIKQVKVDKIHLTSKDYIDIPGFLDRLVHESSVQNT